MRPSTDVNMHDLGLQSKRNSLGRLGVDTMPSPAWPDGPADATRGFVRLTPDPRRADAESMAAAIDDRMFYVYFGRQVRKARLDQGLTQSEVAKFLGLTRASIANVESGRQRLLVHQVVQLSSLLAVGLTDLVPPLSRPEIEAAEIDSAHQALARQVLTEAVD
jgi:DNA-binding XRE family transcriptional regulator